MKKSFFRFLCLTVAMPLLLAACTAAPTGDVSDVSSSKGTLDWDDISLPSVGDASQGSVSFDEVSSAAQSMAQVSSEEETSSEPYSPPADTRVINGKTYQLTFVDEFEGNELDSSKWACCPEWERADIGGKWSDSMVSVKDGCLHLGAAIDENGTPISGAVQNMSKRYQVKWSQCKGYFECRAQLQSAPGFWGAFWLMTRSMNNNDVGQGASNGAEIDIFESFNARLGGINHAIHWDGYGDAHKAKGKEVYKRANYRGFHTFGMAWTDDEYIFYIDGEETWRIGNKDVPNIVCLDPAYMLLTVEFGTWAETVDKTKLPDAVVVDYVRVYQLAD